VPAQSVEPYNEIVGLRQGRVESDPKPFGERCQVFIVEIVAVAQLGIVIRGCAQNRAKGPDVGGMKERLRDRTPQIAIERFQDEGIGAG
jgi:hypothetical protein